jgi:hypothetical protein
MITRKGEAYTQKPGFFWANNSYLCHRKKKPGFLDLKSGDFLRECFAPTGKFVGATETGFLWSIVGTK